MAIIFSLQEKLKVHVNPRTVVSFILSHAFWVQNRSLCIPTCILILFIIFLLIFTISVASIAGLTWSLPLTVVYLLLLERVRFTLAKTRNYMLWKVGVIIGNVVTGILIVLPVMTTGIMISHFLVVSMLIMLMRIVTYTVIGILLVDKKALPYISFGIILIINVRRYYNSLIQSTQN